MTLITVLNVAVYGHLRSITVRWQHQSTYISDRQKYVVLW